ncbi:MAG: hypothetical protein FWG55_03615, partial [Candidatus Bathyarchaeota archaeon]|nr:hypothetical protein [Candidatus Termiticorpusculum sp.]
PPTSPEPTNPPTSPEPTNPPTSPEPTNPPTNSPISPQPSGDGGTSIVAGFSLRDIVIICVSVIVALIVIVAILFVYFQKRITTLEKKN